MPELPEVETTRRGIAPFVTGHTISGVVLRNRRLRWPVPRELSGTLAGQIVESVSRRGKYLILNTRHGGLILHLGMSGSLRVVRAATPPGKFDHVDIVLDNGEALRLRDPRRFGALLWSPEPARHRLLKDLGPEPLSGDFSGDYLYEKSRGRKRAIKEFLMDSHVVAGIGNIYANESLFLAGIRPTRPAGKISRERYRALGRAVRAVLERAIRAGGTTLRDFQQSDGRPGYFSRRLRVYGRAGERCVKCGSAIRRVTMGARSAYFCPRCQH